MEKNCKKAMDKIQMCGSADCEKTVESLSINSANQFR